MLPKRLQITLVLSWYFWDNISQEKPYVMFPLRLQTTLHKKNLFPCCLNFLRTTLHKVTKKNLCHVVQEAPDNIGHEKIQFNNVVILLGQHCTGKNPVQCCPRDSRQHCTGKNPVQYCLNNITFQWFLFWTSYFFDNNRLLQMRCHQCTNFSDNAQENSQANIEQKDKTVWNIRTEAASGLAIN